MRYIPMKYSRVSFFRKIGHIINNRRPDLYDILIILGILLYSLFFSYLSVFKYNVFHLEVDLAIFNQAFWTTIFYGDFFYSSLVGGSQFIVHFSPILFSLLPFYYLFPTPQTLLIAQSILLSLGAIPVYLCGREILDRNLGCLLGLLYLLYPSLHGVNLYDFHELAFIPFLLGMAIMGFTTDKKGLMLLFGFLSLLVKEDISPLIIMMGIAGLCMTRTRPVRERWHYIALIIMGLCTLSLFFGVVRPLLIPVGTEMQYPFLSQYTTPLTSLSTLNDYRISYLAKMFTPLLFLPFLSPQIFVVSIPTFIEILFSTSSHSFSIGYQYSATLIPILFIATVKSLLTIKRSTYIQKHGLFNLILCLLVISSILCSIGYSPASNWLKNYDTINLSTWDDHRDYVNHVIMAIPERASVSTQLNLLPQLSNRKEVFLNDLEKADVIVIDEEILWKPGNFTDHAAIEKNYDLFLHKNSIYLYGKRSNEKMRSEINESIHDSGIFLSGTVDPLK